MGADLRVVILRTAVPKLAHRRHTVFLSLFSLFGQAFCFPPLNTMWTPSLLVRYAIGP